MKEESPRNYSEIKKFILIALNRAIAFLGRYYKSIGKKYPPQAGRALTDAQKEIIVNRILEGWKKHPTLRLGQFIMSALHTTDELFNIEDDILAVRCSNCKWWMHPAFQRDQTKK